MARLLDEAEASDGGKHLRPRLVAAAYFGLGGADRRLLAEVAGAQQLLHLGLCMHDDLIDGDRVRHGRPEPDRPCTTPATAPPASRVPRRSGRRSRPACSPATSP